MFYTGIGSRETPDDVLELMVDIGRELANRGMILRSGAADGADTSFEIGCNYIDRSRKEIYLPWQGFNKSESSLVLSSISSMNKAIESVYKYHPNPYKLSQGAIKLMARNYLQIFGKDNIKSKFVVCWTPNGKLIGGTAQAIKIANDNDIPVYNLFNTDYDLEFFININLN